jgi:hypothetical protein
MQPYCSIPTVRARRLAGRSTMNYTRLVTHGLSAISVFGDVVGVRMLIATIALIVLTLIGTAIAVTIRFATGWAIPGWTTNVVGILLIVLLQGLMFSVLLSFVILGSRQVTTFLPCRDYSFFVGRLRTLYRKP